MAVRSDRRGRGIGRKMMLKAEEFAKQRGFHSFYLSAKSERAISFYKEKCDFKGEIRGPIDGNEFHQLKKIFSFEPMHFNYFLHDVGF